MKTLIKATSVVTIVVIALGTANLASARSPRHPSIDIRHPTYASTQHQWHSRHCMRQVYVSRWCESTQESLSTSSAGPDEPTVTGDNEVPIPHAQHSAVRKQSRYVPTCRPAPTRTSPFRGVPGWPQTGFGPWNY